MKSNKNPWLRIVLLCLLVGFAYLIFLFLVEVRIYFFDSHHSEICSEIEISKSRLDSINKVLYSRYERFTNPDPNYACASNIIFGVSGNTIKTGDWYKLNFELEKIRNNDRSDLYYSNLNYIQKYYLGNWGIESEAEYIEKVINRYLYNSEGLLKEYCQEFENNTRLWKQREQTWREWDAFNLQIKRIKKPIMILALVALLGVLIVFFYRRLMSVENEKKVL